MRIIALVILLCYSLAFGADCEKALFGWTTKSGRHINGTLTNEGVSKRNPRGFQTLKSDKGNYRKGVFCGGTAFGWACADLPSSIDVTTLTREQAIKLYHDTQWKEVRGDDFLSQYIAYKVFDLTVNRGNPHDFCLTVYQKSHGAVVVANRVTPEMVKWVNDNTKDRDAREAFIDRMILNAMQSYILIVKHTPKDEQFFKTWIIRTGDDE